MLLWCELWSDLKFYFFKEGSEKIFLSESSRLGPAGTYEFTVTIKSNSSLYGSKQYFAQIQVRSIQACVGRQQSIANKITKRAERNLCFKLLKNTPNVVQFRKQALKVTIFKRSGLFLTILIWVLNHVRDGIVDVHIRNAWHWHVEAWVCWVTNCLLSIASASTHSMADPPPSTYGLPHWITFVVFMITIKILSNRKKYEIYLKSHATSLNLTCKLKFRIQNPFG